jgi:UDPglucose--hexose-1-phosphate uridylyltransferase
MNDSQLSDGDDGKRFWRSTRLLADGREIIYFDEAPGLRRAEAVDRRDLLPSPMEHGGASVDPGAGSVDPGGASTEPGGANGELRLDPLLGEWVGYAATRQDRTFLPAVESCPLCPTRPGFRTEIPASGYDVVVFENRFPVLRGAVSPSVQSGTEERGTEGSVAQGPGADGPGAEPPGDVQSPSDALLIRRPGYGRCEVICFTADHDASFASLSVPRIATVMQAWADRTRELGSIPGIEHVYCFENSGEEVGVTLRHPHGQIYAWPFVPPRVRQLDASAQAYRARWDRNLFDDLVANELADGRRVVARNDHWVAFVPSAARWPYEVMIFPAVRAADLPALSEPAQAAFGEIGLDVLRRMNQLFQMPMPYIAAWQQAPVNDQAARAEFAVHLQILGFRRAPGKLKFLAGTESGAGVWSNDVLPETAARNLREAGQ